MAKKAKPNPDTPAGYVPAMLCELLGVDEAEVTPEASLTDDLGADSLDLVEMVMDCEERFSIEIQDEQADKVKTVQQLIDLVDQVRSQPVPAAK